MFTAIGVFWVKISKTYLEEGAYRVLSKYVKE